MDIGITYNLRDDGTGEGFPDDHDEEFDSPVTIDAIAGVLTVAGHRVRKLGFGRMMIESLLADPPDLVFNIAEGLAGRSRESQVPALLEMLGLPYTGSGPLTLGVTLDKDLAKNVVASRGIPTPRHILVEKHRDFESDDLQGLDFPLVVKPAFEGSSKGIRNSSLVTGLTGLNARVKETLDGYCGPAMIEEFLDGPEFTVGIIGNNPPQVVGVMMIRHRTLPPEKFLYSLEVKRDWRNQVEYIVPPPLPETDIAAISDLALAAYTALGCRDVSRVDVRLRGGRPFFLEVNPLPGLSPDYGDLVIMARAMGWSYDQLVLAIVDHALARTDRRRSADG